MDDPPNDQTVDHRPLKETGIRLSWDDGQVATWLNRQWDPTQPAFDSPLGTAGYRVDVKLKSTTEWRSIMLASADLKIGNVGLGVRTTEMLVSLHPAQLDGKLEGVYWVPMYSWVGPALGTRNLLQFSATGLPESGSIMKGVKPGVALQYGRSYDFHVRLMVTSGGGPRTLEEATIPGPCSHRIESLQAIYRTRSSADN